MAQNSQRLKVGFLGGGNMAKAMAAALVRAGVCSAADINMSARTQASLDAIRALGYGTGTNEEVAKRTDGGLLFVTVKPAGAVYVLSEARNFLSSVALVVSACVGVSLTTLTKAVPDIPIARIMPNVLCAIGEGSTGYCMSASSDAPTAMLIRALEAFGPAHAIPESLFDVYSAISGSNTAVGFLGKVATAKKACFVDELVRATKARHLSSPSSKRLSTEEYDGTLALRSSALFLCIVSGMSRDLAREAVLQSVRGTATLAQMEQQHPAVLRDRITSPGGTTIAGLLAMERRTFRASVAEAVEAACERSKEIQSSQASDGRS